MKKKIVRMSKTFVRHMFKTFKNKIFAIALMILGYASTLVDGDATFFVATILFGIPLIFAKENWII